MNQLVPITAYGTLIAAAGKCAQRRFFEFFTANIRNRNTRRAYAHAMREFLAWCDAQAKDWKGVGLLEKIRPIF